MGQHEGGYDPFTFDITDALKPGAEQELVVAVWDPTDTALQPRGKQVLNPNGIWYTAVSGIWQTVWLEPVPAAHIRELAMTPDIDAHELRLTVRRGGLGGFHGDGEIARQGGGPRHREDQRRGEAAAQPDGAVVARFAGALRSGHRAEVRRLGEELLRHAQR